MNRIKEQEIFFNYIKDIYLSNPELQINEDTIYKELMLFYENNGARERINENGLLLNVQQKLAKKFGSKFGHSGYFWLFENRDNLNDNAYYDILYNSIKIYVSIDAINLCEVSTKIFEYMTRENIITQSKVAKIMRNDVLVLRVATQEDAIKLINYINSLNYKSKIKTNPFLLTKDKVGITKDGCLSYNTTLCKVISNYLNECKINNTLNEANINDLYTYINKTINMLKGPYKSKMLKLYEINSEQEYEDYLMVMNIISKNLNGTITLEQLFSLSRDNNVEELSTIQKEDRDKIKYILSCLSKYYTTNDIHRIILKYIETGDLTYFTRRDNIRQIAASFSPEKLNNIINEMSTNALLDAIIITEERYPNMSQSEFAIKLFILNGDLSGFTNYNNSRSYLGLVSPPEKLLDILRKKLPYEEQKKLEQITNLSTEEKKIIEMMISNSPELIKIPYEYLAKAKSFEIILNNLAHTIKNNICQENQIKQKVGRK
ncbi:MAG: hypothetical protein ACI310_06585 [Bacilli bacterium]